MTAAVKRHLPFAGVVLASAGITLSNAVIGARTPPLGPGDYPHDGGPPIMALAHLHLSQFFASNYVMGPFSLMLRAPFAALAGDPLGAYRWGAFACVLAAGLLGLYLARLAMRRGRSPIEAAVIVGVCVLNPLTFEALRGGHPEEILTAAMAVGAVAVAWEGHRWRAALLLGLALASKQWAVIAILPVLMAVPSRRLLVGAGAAGVTLLLVAPSIVAQPHVFADAQSNVAFGHRYIDAWTAWYPFAGSSPGKLVGGPHGVTVTPFSGGSALVGHYAHPLIVLCGLGLPLALAARRRSFALRGSEAMLLLALLALLRCALDPADNAYYHLPVLLALAGWDSLAERSRSLWLLAAAAIALALSSWSAQLEPRVFNLLYLAAVVPTLIAIAMTLWRPGYSWQSRARPNAIPRRAGQASAS